MRQWRVLHSRTENICHELYSIHTVQCHSSHRLVLSTVCVPSDALRRHLASCSECTPLSVVVTSAGGRASIYSIRVVAPCCLRTVLLCGFCSVSSDDALDMDEKSCSVNYMTRFVSSDMFV